MQHLIEIERVSATRAYAERFFVAVSASTVADACALLEFSLEESEHIISAPLAREPHIAAT